MSTHIQFENSTLFQDLEVRMLRSYDQPPEYSPEDERRIDKARKQWDQLLKDGKAARDAGEPRDAIACHLLGDERKRWEEGWDDRDEAIADEAEAELADTQIVDMSQFVVLGGEG
ncbi:MAG: hypothetical protein U0798_15280 [Gemmataceae bacterium]